MINEERKIFPYRYKGKIVLPVTGDKIITKHEAFLQVKPLLSEFAFKLVTLIYANLPDEIEHCKEYSFKVRNIIKALGHDDTNLYKHIKNTIKEILSIPIVLDSEKFDLKKEFIAFNYFNEVDYDKGILTIKVPKKAIPLIRGLKSNFVQYNVKNIIFLKGKYTLRFYEIFKHKAKLNEYYKKKKAFTLKYSIDEFREFLILENKYPTTQGLKYILEKAKKELALKSDIAFDYEFIKDGRTTAGIIFYIKDNIPTVTKKIPRKRRLEKVHKKKRVLNLEEYNKSIKKVNETIKKGLEKSKNTKEEIQEILNKLEEKVKDKEKIKVILKEVLNIVENPENNENIKTVENPENIENIEDKTIQNSTVNDNNKSNNNSSDSNNIDNNKIESEIVIDGGESVFNNSQTVKAKDFYPKRKELKKEVKNDNKNSPQTQKSGRYSLGEATKMQVKYMEKLYKSEGLRFNGSKKMQWEKIFYSLNKEYGYREVSKVISIIKDDNQFYYQNNFFSPLRFKNNFDVMKVWVNKFLQNQKTEGL